MAHIDQTIILAEGFLWALVTSTLEVSYGIHPLLILSEGQPFYKAGTL